MNGRRGRRAGNAPKNTGAGDGTPGTPERVGDALSRMLERLGVAREVASQSAIPRWEETVGPRIAGVTRAKAVSSGVLFVEVRSSAWLNELNLMRREIMKRLNAGQEEARIDRIIFTLSEDGPGMERGGQDR